MLLTGFKQLFDFFFVNPIGTNNAVDFRLFVLNIQGAELADLIPRLKVPNSLLLLISSTISKEVPSLR